MFNATRTIKVNDHMYPMWRLRIDDETNEVRWDGVQTGPLTLHSEGRDALVLKEAGHSWYLNQYQGQQYEAAKFIVFTKEDDGSITRLTDFYIKAK